MEIIDIRVEENKALHGIKVFLKSVEGEIIEVSFKKKAARRLMRAIFLRIGVNPRLGRGSDTLPDFAREYGKE